MATITINRAGKTLGPYSVDEVRRYLAEGRLGATEPACANGDQRWEPLQTVLNRVDRPVQPQPQPYVQPQSRPMSNGPMPPSLHWMMIMVLSFVSGGIFMWIWQFVQASFVKKIDPSSRATLFYALSLGGTALFIFAGMALPNSTDFTLDQTLAALVAFAALMGSVVFAIVGAYSMRESLQTYYRDVEPLGTGVNGRPIGLHIGGAMTFFFNVIYIQYHLWRLAKWKETGSLY